MGTPFENLQKIKIIIRGKIRQAQDIAGDIWLIALPLFLVIGLVVVTTRFWIWATSWLS